MSQLRVMNPREGDFKVSWDKGDPESLENARSTFEDLIKPSGSFRAYKVSSETGKREGQPIATFDPDAEELLIVPQMAGG